MLLYLSGFIGREWEVKAEEALLKEIKNLI
jgi:hypothetical protein